MRFLIDEDLPRALVAVFAARNFNIERVYNIPELRGKSDEVIFDYNELPVSLMCLEVQQLTKNLRDAEFNNLIVVEPGYIRIRAMPRGFM